MKTILSSSCLCLLSVGTLLAQPKSSTEDLTPIDRPGYWEVSTDYRTNGTAIRYFNADKRLIHQEIHSNKLVKLTKNNVRRLNATVTKVTQNQLEPSNVKTVSLPTDNEDPRIAHDRKRLMTAERRASTADVMARIVPSVVGFEPCLKVFIYNPHEERLRIEILNSKGFAVCQEYSNTYQRYYRFNMSNMPVGDYRVQIYKASEKKPSFENLVSLSRKPSQAFISTKPDVPAGSAVDSLVSEKD
ncbi:hypothetical protein [Larkinella humicola]|uniref:Uncharacterized protein n=1 Tax=Larkinella humicola TaxID=2607654 RepID=A0A5N1JMJ4_9BACT|nr:hypothetical protein [Larkinella humicola]KAA9356657.1 hypothetical protein F0P93_02595 [Larkinella humicola]